MQVMQISSYAQTAAMNYQNFSNEIFEKKNPVALIVEGNAEKREALKMLLRLYDVEVLESCDGEEALDVTVFECPDMVFINTKLPKIDGFETTRLIRTIQSFAAMPIVFLSESTERALRKKAYDVGGNSFHAAPLNLERLKNILDIFWFNAVLR